VTLAGNFASGEAQRSAVTSTGASLTVGAEAAGEFACAWTRALADKVAMIERKIRVGRFMEDEARPELTPEKRGASRALKKRRNPRLLFPSSA
jgi:hypothetical protein